ncbi:MAG: hypothetical protein ACYC4S_08710 [Rhodoferax sp.]
MPGVAINAKSLKYKPKFFKTRIDAGQLSKFSTFLRLSDGLNVFNRVVLVGPMGPLDAIKVVFADSPTAHALVCDRVLWPG